MRNIFLKLFNKKIFALGMGLFMVPMAANALSPEQSTVTSIASNDSFLWLILTLEIILILLGLVLIFVILKMKNILFGKEEAVLAEAVAEKPSAFAALWQKLSDAVPVEREEEVMTDHEYDGIIELDNNLPPWWKMLFNLSIIFSAVYIGYYHFSDAGPSSEEEYVIAMEEARVEVEAFMAQKANSVDELNVVAVTDASVLADGEKIYLASCAACHGNEGQGGVGPNMTDAYWLHGGDIKDIFKTIKYGVPEKGMIPWKTQLSPSQMQSVASYLLTLVGTNPANPKEPQGELYSPIENNQPEEEENINDKNMSKNETDETPKDNISMVQ
ncbi:MAG: cbb3-type cytochrome c oxidase N-terminal domain-containing protein [Bacteroidota bacterium]